jgi:hypothetical protein
LGRREAWRGRAAERFVGRGGFGLDLDDQIVGHDLDGLDGLDISFFARGTFSLGFLLGFGDRLESPIKLVDLGTDRRQRDRGLCGLKPGSLDFELIEAGKGAFHPLLLCEIHGAG